MIFSKQQYSLKISVFSTRETVVLNVIKFTHLNKEPRNKLKFKPICYFILHVLIELQK